MKKINLDLVTQRFEDHLKIEDNYRIILSGKFGVGKTFFLKTFFESKSDQYNTIFINPINYVVSPNEDIFELIKVDIIKQLYTTPDLTKKQNRFTKAERIAMFASEKPQHFLKFVTSSFKKINPFVEIADDLYDGLEKLYSEYKQYEKNLEEKYKISEEKIAEFAASFSIKTGSIFEEDFITKAIKQKLVKLKGNKKKNVLIIDDLDRIDPEHVFRILNILSAHNNSFGTKNKFEFDHIIIVCDNENIKNIFYHKYGEAVDYDGYIDKFYSTDIFKYENDEALKFYLKSTFIVEQDSSGFIDLVLFILNILISKDKLTTRKIIKHRYNYEGGSFVLYEQSGLQEKNTTVKYVGTIFKNDFLFVSSEDLRILSFFKLISIIYGDFNDFYRDLEDLIKIKTSKDREQFNQMFSFLALQSHISGNLGDKLFFKLSYGKNYRDEDVLQKLHWPVISLFSKTYQINLGWNESNPYDGSHSYFLKAQALDTDRHQHLGNKPKEFIDSSEILNGIKEIILQCNAKDYLSKIGIVLKLR
jgi:hypothetical protein